MTYTTLARATCGAFCSEYPIAATHYTPEAAAACVNLLLCIIVRAHHRRFAQHNAQRPKHKTGL